MAPSEPAFDVVADERVDGIADRVARLADVGDEEAAAVLEAGISADRVPLGTERGVRDTLQRAIARLRRQRMVEDLGEAESSFEVLGVHVPPGGRAAVDLRRSASADRQVSFSVFGFGFGSGRTVTVELSEGIPERTCCMRVLQQVVVHVRRFHADEHADLIRTDVVRCGARELVAWPDCPHCGTGTEPDPFEYDLESDAADALDLRGYDAEISRERTLRLEGVRKAEIGLDLPLPGAVPLRAGFNLELRTSMSCTVAYGFPPGRRFVPFRGPGDRAALPYWRAS